jgi:integrase
MAIESREKNGKKQYRYRCYYSDVYGNRKQKNSKWFDTKKEAKEHEAAFINSSYHGNCNAKFGDIYDEYVQDSKNRNCKRTIRTKEDIKRLYLQPLCDRNISKIKTKEIIDLLSSDPITKLSTSRKNIIYAYIKCCFDYAIQHYGLSSNPIRTIPRFKKNTEEKLKEMTVITVDEFNQIYNCLKSKDRYIHKEVADVLWILFWTGMRINECMSLTFKDFNKRTLTVRKQYIQNEWDTLKSDYSIRKIVIDSNCENIIKKQYEHYKGMPGFSDSWFIFGGYKPTLKETIKYYKDKAIEETGVIYFRIHDLRHSHVAYLIDKNVNVYKISKRLGHSSLSITMKIYGHLLDKEEDEIIDAINENFEN